MGFLDLLGFLWFLSAVGSILGIPFEIFAWLRSRDNRAERRLARREGRPPPAPERWTIAFLALFPLVVVAFGVSVALLVAHFSR